MKTHFFGFAHILVGAVLLSAFFIANLYAYEGWTSDGDKVVYVNGDGYRIANTFRERDGYKYFLDENGYVVYNKVFEYNDDIYYVSKGGERVTNEFVNVTSDMIMGAGVTPGTYFFGEDGKAYKRKTNKFTRNIGGKLYAFDDEGHVLMGYWISEDGNLLEPDDDILKDGMYFARGDGVMFMNEWYAFSDDLASYKDLGESSSISNRYEDLDKLWVYFDKEGKKCVGTEGALKKKKINGHEYAFDENGILLLGFQKNQVAADYTQMSNPSINETIKYYESYSGELAKNKWVYTTTPLSFDTTEHYDGKYYWFYIGSDGAIVKNKVRNIDNKKYIFDGFGRAKGGFIISDGIGQYVADYKSEDLSSFDFVYSVDDGSRLYGTDLADLFYFKEKEDDSDAFSMQTGNVELELEDGKYEFCFRNTGRAVGNNNKLTLFKDCYYKNGIKYIPWEGTRYGVVKVSDTEYRVINNHGKVVKGKRKLFKDDYGNYMIILNNKLAGYVAEQSRKIQLKWETAGGFTGYHVYDLDADKRTRVGIAVLQGATCPSDEELNDIPDDLKVNFK